MGLREIWYFGLQFNDINGQLTWLKLGKKVLSHNVAKETPLQFKLRVKYYPESVSEIIEENTLNLFFLQVKEAILNEEIYCPPETCARLASYATHAKYGDYNPVVHVKGFLANDRLLPKKLIEQYNYSEADWHEKIIHFFQKHVGLLRQEAMMEYLKIAQELQMYGVSYFDVMINRVDLLVGVNALGLNIYEKEDKLTPKNSLKWSELRNITNNDKKFVATMIDKRAADFVFFAHSSHTNKIIHSLCMGNHELYMRRRKADSIQVQYMKAQAKEKYLKEKERVRNMSNQEQPAKQAQLGNEVASSNSNGASMINSDSNINNTPSGEALENERTNLINKRYLKQNGDDDIIGKGSFAIVYLVRDLNDSLKEKVLKHFYLNNDDSGDMIEEANLLSTLDCDHIVKYYDCFLYQSRWCLVLEYCQDGDLAKKIKQMQETNNRFSDKTICEYLSQILKGICFLHSKNIIHRDIKPENLFLKKNAIKLGDLGLAKLMLSKSNLSTRAGTFNYMSPEIHQGLQYRKNSDVWSFGCVAYEIVELKRAFDGPSDYKIMKAIVENDAPKFVSNNKFKIVAECTLVKDPSKRLESEQVLFKLNDLFNLTISSNESNF